MPVDSNQLTHHKVDSVNVLLHLLVASVGNSFAHCKTLTGFFFFSTAISLSGLEVVVEFT